MLIKPIVVPWRKDRLALLPVPLANRSNLFLLDSQTPEIGVVNIPDDIVSAAYLGARHDRRNAISVLLVLNDRCNLACSYCFERRGTRTNRQLHESCAFRALDFVANNAARQGSREVFVSLFGGEPTLSFPLIKTIVAHANEECLKRELEVKFGITTNGYCDEKVCEYLANHFYSLIYSLDGPQYLHDKQRPTGSGQSTFTRVLRNAKKLFAILGPEKLTFRVTIADNGLPESRELVDFFENEFPGAHVHLEPALNVGEPSKLLFAYRSFARAFIDMLRFRRTIHLQHSNLLFKFKQDPQEIDFCGASHANFYVTPDGYLTACSRALRLDDQQAEIFFIGRITGNDILIEQDAIDRLRVLTVGNFAACKECFARFNCKGGCPWLRRSLQVCPETWAGYCAIVRDLTREYLVSCLEAGSNAPFNVASINM